MTGVSRRVPALDGLRGVAILLVVVGHGRIGPTHTAGPVGVTVFFVLSGYLISGIVLNAEARGAWSWSAFYARRAARLLPALFVMLFVVGGFVIAAGWSASLYLRSAVAAALYVANWRFIFGGEGPIAQTWSLSVEEQFYLLWPLALLALVRRGWLRWVPWLAAAALLWRLVAAPWVGFRWSLYATDMCAGGLLAGAALHALPRPRVTAAAAWASLAGLLALAFAPYDVPWASWATVPATVLACMLVHANGFAPLGAAWLRYVGRISYGIYLWHFPLIYVAMGFGVGHVGQVVVEVFGGVGLAALSWWALERPILDRVHGVWVTAGTRRD